MLDNKEIKKINKEINKILFRLEKSNPSSNFGIDFMGFIEIFLIGIGLSMDAFAVAVCKGLKMHKINLKQTAVISLFFGGFQALMPTLGYLIGNSFDKYVQKGATA